jgi:hypothetical protein
MCVVLNDDPAPPPPRPTRTGVFAKNSSSLSSLTTTTAFAASNTPSKSASDPTLDVALEVVGVVEALSFAALALRLFLALSACISALAASRVARLARADIRASFSIASARLLGVARSSPDE